MDKQLTFIVILVTVLGIGVFVWFLSIKGIDLGKYQKINLTPPKTFSCIYRQYETYKQRFF